MNRRSTFISMLVLVLTMALGQAQTILHQESFETDGDGTRYT